MKHCNFIKHIEAYYGKYEQTKKKYVEAYIRKNYKENDLSKIFNLIVESYSGQYKYTPDINIIEKAINNYNKENDYPSERIDRIGKITYITDDPQYAKDCGRKREIS